MTKIKSDEAASDWGFREICETCLTSTCNYHTRGIFLNRSTICPKCGNNTVEYLCRAVRDKKFSLFDPTSWFSDWTMEFKEIPDEDLRICSRTKDTSKPKNF